MKIILSALITILGSVFAHAATQYNIDTAHSSVGFSVTHLMISKVTGRFDKFEGQFAFDEKTGQVEGLNAKIDLDSINTNEPKRDEHLKSADFFGVRDDKKALVEDKRWMTFVGKKTTTKGKKPNQISGDLTINGITKPVTLTVNYRGVVKDPWGNQKLGFDASTKVKRSDFGLKWNKALEAGGVVVGEEVAINIDGEATAVNTAKK